MFALLRLPRLVKFIPTPVMAGFQNAAAIAIGVSQLHIMLGLANRPAISGWLDALSSIRPLQLALGLATLTLVFKGQRLAKSFTDEVLALEENKHIRYRMEEVVETYGAF